MSANYNSLKPVHNAGKMTHNGSFDNMAVPSNQLNAIVAQHNKLGSHGNSKASMIAPHGSSNASKLA
jgi:hypothetical protein